MIPSKGHPAAASTGRMLQMELVLVSVPKTTLLGASEPGDGQPVMAKLVVVLHESRPSTI